MTVLKCISFADMLTNIKIVDINHTTLTSGKWYQDNILEHIRDAVIAFSYDDEENEMKIQLAKEVE